MQVVTLDGVNHLLVPAKTGDLDEYPQLAGKGGPASRERRPLAWFEDAC